MIAPTPRRLYFSSISIETTQQHWCAACRGHFPGWMKAFDMSWRANDAGLRKTRLAGSAVVPFSCDCQRGYYGGYRVTRAGPEHGTGKTSVLLGAKKDPAAAHASGRRGVARSKPDVRYLFGMSGISTRCCPINQACCSFARKTSEMARSFVPSSPTESAAAAI